MTTHAASVGQSDSSSAETAWIRDVTRVCTRAAEGDLEARILHIDDAQPHARMLHAINHMLDMTDAFVREAGASLSFASDGKYFRRVLPDGLLGSFGQAAQTINGATIQMGTEAAQLSEAEKERSELIDDITHAKEVSVSLAKCTADIEKLFSVISDVASRTNLLALNATIEAARVGKVGAGFAVVAEEVKRLADQTASVTREIQENVFAIKSSSADTVKSIDRIWEVLDRQEKARTTEGV